MGIESLHQLRKPIKGAPFRSASPVRLAQARLLGDPLARERIDSPPTARIGSSADSA